MSEKKNLYAAEYFEVLNNALKQHPQYRIDMKFTGMDIHGNLVFDTKDKTISSDDINILNEVVEQVTQTHKLIIP